MNLSCFWMTTLALVHSGYAAFFLGCNKTEQEIFPSLLELRWGIVSGQKQSEFIPYMTHVITMVISPLHLQTSTQSHPDEVSLEDKEAELLCRHKYKNSFFEKRKTFLIWQATSFKNQVTLQTRLVLPSPPWFERALKARLAASTASSLWDFVCCC